MKIEPLPENLVMTQKFNNVYMCKSQYTQSGILTVKKITKSHTFFASQITYDF